MKTLIVDNRISYKCERALLKEGFTLIKIPADPTLGEAVASHPDTVAFYFDGELITTADYCDKAPYVFSDLRELCPDVRQTFTCDRREAIYPSDAIMNALVVGDRMFCNTSNISGAILEFAKRRGLSVHHVNQGYPACTTLAFGNCAITADQGMAAALIDVGIEVTLINNGGISLPPYEYGFIGGACGVYEDKVYFFGNLDLHPDSEIIKQSLARAGYTPVSLSDEELGDFGGFISI